METNTFTLRLDVYGLRRSEITIALSTFLELRLGRPTEWCHIGGANDLWCITDALGREWKVMAYHNAAPNVLLTPTLKTEGADIILADTLREYMHKQARKAGGRVVTKTA